MNAQPKIGDLLYVNSKGKLQIKKPHCTKKTVGAVCRIHQKTEGRRLVEFKVWGLIFGQGEVEL